jgi:hypothetical protein
MSDWIHEDDAERQLGGLHRGTTSIDDVVESADGSVHIVFYDETLRTTDPLDYDDLPEWAAVIADEYFEDEVSARYADSYTRRAESGWAQ